MNLENLLAFNSETFWLLLGFTAQALFGARFVVQWIFSERQGKKTRRD
jgi:lipid-A-disaccharide synthase-like uncharacterized protein